MNEVTSQPSVTQDIFCRSCGYSLMGTVSQTCGECGQGFVMDDATSFSHDATHTHANERFLKWLVKLHFAFVLVWLAMFPALLLKVAQVDRWAVDVFGWLLIPLMTLALLLMAMQTIMAVRVFSYRYAFGHLAFSMVFLPFFMISVNFVAVQVMDDIKRRWQQPHGEG